jgi:hypothetical protein
MAESKKSAPGTVVCRTLAQLAGTQRSVRRAGSVERAFKARCAELAADAARFLGSAVGAVVVHNVETTVRKHCS